MQYRIDGDQLMISADSFVNLQESPAIFIPITSELAKAILAEDKPSLAIMTTHDGQVFRVTENGAALLVKPRQEPRDFYENEIQIHYACGGC